ncbi:16S rRNA (guanine(527)-N(7))-methyltransferase RsmG [Spirochaetota bacterium]
MERHNVRELFEANGILIDNSRASRLEAYARMVYEENTRFNLTGKKSFTEVVEHLVVQSITPILGLKVPRRTLFADIGTGAGIPGVPIGILYDDMNGVLIESNLKKVNFIKSVIKELGIRNLTVLNERIEEIGRNSEYREKFNIVFSRALGSLYMVLELSAPLLANSGISYVYSNEDIENIDTNVVSHAVNLGMEPFRDEKSSVYNIGSYGLIFRKVKATDSRYPRRFAVIKRESQKFNRIV